MLLKKWHAVASEFFLADALRSLRNIGHCRHRTIYMAQKHVYSKLQLCSKVRYVLQSKKCIEMELRS